MAEVGESDAVNQCLELDEKQQQKTTTTTKNKNKKQLRPVGPVGIRGSAALAPAAVALPT